MALSLSTELCWVLILTLLLCLHYYPAYPYAALLGCCRIDHQCVSDLLQYKDADSAISKFLHHAVCKYLPQNSAVFVSNFLTLEYVLHSLACIALWMQLHTASIFYQDVYYRLLQYFCMWLTMRYMRSCHMYLLWMEWADRGPSLLCKWRSNLFGSCWYPQSTQVPGKKKKIVQPRVSGRKWWLKHHLNMRAKSVGWNLCPNCDHLIYYLL